MSMKSCSRAIGGDLRSAGPAEREEWKRIIKALAHLTRIAFRRLPSGLLVNVGAGALELICKAKAGFSVEKMLTTARQADPDVDQIVSELQREIALESGTEEEQPRVELGSRNPALADPRRGPGQGNAPPAETTQATQAAQAGGDAGPTLAPGRWRR